jgi:hypothetical protein
MYLGFKGTLTGWAFGWKWWGNSVVHVVCLYEAFNSPRHFIKLNDVTFIQCQLLVTVSVEVNCVVCTACCHQRYDCAKDARRGDVETNILYRTLHDWLDFVLSSYPPDEL